MIVQATIFTELNALEIVGMHSVGYLCGLGNKYVLKHRCKERNKPFLLDNTAKTESVKQSQETSNKRSQETHDPSKIKAPVW